MKFRVFAPATTANLGPGFDVFGAALDFGNELEVRLDSEFQIDIYGEGSTSLPRSEDNLIYQAFLKTFDYMKRKPVSAAFVVKNRIPLVRGLGSSASAIILGILAAQKICSVKDLEMAAEIAIEMEGHPDNIIPALFGGIRLCYRTSSKWKSEALSIPENLSLVLFVPLKKLPTAKARKAIGKSVLLEDAVYNISHSCLLVYSLEKKRYDLLKEATLDRIHQDKRLKLIPGIEEIFKEIVAHKLCLGGWLSGAGSTLAFLTKKENEDEVANFVRERADSRGEQCKVITASFSPKGAEVKEVV